ncbi:uncharacterized protein [Euwallacea similis]|uniref:uncharacterized protein isoform X2 n=1 Tax=Euwallacea similis TaxID=1736056 RepID=UPI00344E235B
MIKKEILIEEWRKFQSVKLQKRLKMNHPCRLEVMNPIIVIDTTLKFITQGERKIVFSGDQEFQYVILMEHINGYMPNQREGTIQISYRNQMQAVLTFPTPIYYTAALRALENVLRAQQIISFSISPPFQETRRKPTFQRDSRWVRRSWV